MNDWDNGYAKGAADERGHQEKRLQDAIAWGRAEERKAIVEGISDLRRRMSTIGASDQTILALYDAAVIAQNGGQ